MCITSNIRPLSCCAVVINSLNSFSVYQKLFTMQTFLSDFHSRMWKPVHATSIALEQSPCVVEIPIRAGLSRLLHLSNSRRRLDGIQPLKATLNYSVVTQRNRQFRGGRLLDRQSLPFTQISHLQSGEVGIRSASILPGSQVLFGTSQVVLGPKTQLRASRVRSPVKRTRLVTNQICIPFLSNLRLIRSFCNRVFVTRKTLCLSRGQAVDSVPPR